MGCHELGLGGKSIFRAECNSQKFGLYLHTIEEKSFLLFFCISNAVLIIFPRKMFSS